MYIVCTLYNYVHIKNIFKENVIVFEPFIYVGFEHSANPGLVTEVL